MVGLGNPGAEYEATRHNAGFWLADALAARWRLPRFKREGPAHATGGETAFGKVQLLKPQTMMNASGRVLRGLRPKGPAGPLEDLLILVDDFALPVGTFRIRSQGSAGGHNGLRSVEFVVGTRQYARLRIGIGPLPQGASGWADFVLEDMSKTDRRDLDDLMPAMCDAVECWMESGVDAAMARYNRKVSEPQGEMGDG